MSLDWYAYKMNEAGERQILGSCAEVRAQIEHLLGVEWEGDFSMALEIDGVGVEIDVGGFDSRPSDPVSTVEFVTRGPGDAVAALLQITQPLGLVLEETDSGDRY